MDGVDGTGRLVAHGLLDPSLSLGALPCNRWRYATLAEHEHV